MIILQLRYPAKHHDALSHEYLDICGNHLGDPGPYLADPNDPAKPRKKIPPRLVFTHIV